MSNRELLNLNLRRNRRSFEAFLLLVAALEAMMMVYGILLFDFHELRRRLYFGCYVLLFCATVAAFAINRFCYRSGKQEKLMAFNACFYNMILIFLSAAISALDMVGGGYPVTYMTIMAAVGSMVAVPPVLYGIAGALSSVLMLAMALAMGRTGLHFPFYLNHGIFLLVVIAVEVRNHHTLRKQYELDRQLEELAEIDSLTHISNRRALDRYLAGLIGEGKCFSFALMDVDNFKSINDCYGHQEGDLSLLRIAGILTETFGQTVYRYGGDEFAVISMDTAETMAERFDGVNHRLREEVKGYLLQTCAGVYHSREEDDERKILKSADDALYEAKHNGKGKAVIYTGAPS